MRDPCDPRLTTFASGPEPTPLITTSWNWLDGSNRLPYARHSMSRESLCVIVIVSACLSAQVTAGAADVAELLDFTHIELAFHYFATPSEALLDEMSKTGAAIHLKRHSDRTGYYPANATSRSITEDLLRKLPSEDRLQAVRNLVAYAAQDPIKRRECFRIASSYLPEQAQPGRPLFITWGYDIGVAMDDHASLNLAHRHFLADRQEIWFYCVHEVHHSGLTRIHPMPRIANTDSVGKLLEFVRYSTFIEGLAVHAAREARKAGNALANDDDYRALGDADALGEVMARHHDRLMFLQSEWEQPLRDEHWQVVEEMSSGERLWYVAGTHMADTIEKTCGRSRLLKAALLGPASFFDAYDSAQERGSWSCLDRNRPAEGQQHGAREPCR